MIVKRQFPWRFTWTCVFSVFIKFQIIVCTLFGIILNYNMTFSLQMKNFNVSWLIHDSWSDALILDESNIVQHLFMKYWFSSCYTKTIFSPAIHKFYDGLYTDLLLFNSSARCPTLRVARAETRLTVYRSSYIIRVRSYLASLSPCAFLGQLKKVVL